MSHTVWTELHLFHPKASNDGGRVDGLPCHTKPAILACTNKNKINKPKRISDVQTKFLFYFFILS